MKTKGRGLVCLIRVDVPIRNTMNQMINENRKYRNRDQREFIIPMAIMLFLSIVQGSCGVDTISYYSLTIFRLAKISVDEYLMAILLQVSLFSILESHHGFGIGVQIFKGCSALEILFKIRFFAPGG